MRVTGCRANNVCSIFLETSVKDVPRFMNTGQTERGASDSPHNFYCKIPEAIVIKIKKLKHNLDKDVYV